MRCNRSRATIALSVEVLAVLFVFLAVLWLSM
jgi:hypothetical protein